MSAYNWYDALLYEWHQFVSFCYDGANVTSVYDRYYDTEEVCCNYHDNGITSENDLYSGFYEVHSYMRGEMEQCILIDFVINCGQDQAEVDIFMYGDGGWRVEGGIDW